MKIDNSGNAIGAYTTTSKVAKRDSNTNAPASTATAARAESVEINPLASHIGTVETQANATPAFDAAKVEAIKSAIASGSFSVNPEKIAGSLIASARELLAK